MQFTPKTAKELAEEGLLTPGEFDFEVLDAFDAVSKSSGRDMITVKLKVYTESGATTLLTDYLMESMGRKLRHACEATGMLDAYESGVLDAHDFVGKAGRVKLKIEVDKSGQYPDKNAVSDYVPREAATFPAEKKKAPPAKARQKVEPQRQQADALIDDEIPF